MASKKRWGKKHKDNRNWKRYNEELVMRGYFYINPRFLETWNGEINQMNAGKVGQPYLYPKSMIEFLAVLQPKFDVRALEGIMRAISKAYYNFPTISYSQINRRLNKLDVTFPVQDDNIVFDDVVGCDGTGIKVNNRGEWIRQKWKIRRGWIKVVILGNKRGKVVDVIVGTEELNENDAFQSMMQAHHESISTVSGDGWFDTIKNFNLCRKLQVTPAIKISENSSGNANGSMLRAKHVKEYQKMGYKKWREKYGYGYRWVCTEGIFSAVKRMEGECVRATKMENMLHEAKMKFWIYNKIRENCVAN